MGGERPCVIKTGLSQQGGNRTGGETFLNIPQLLVLLTYWINPYSTSFFVYTALLCRFPPSHRRRNPCYIIHGSLFPWGNSSLHISCLSACSVGKWCLTLCYPMDCSPPSSSAHGTFQARILEWVAMLSSRGSSQPRDWTHISYVSCIAHQVLCHWATWDFSFIFLLTSTLQKWLRIAH